jgi:hypothetical protein
MRVCKWVWCTGRSIVDMQVGLVYCGSAVRCWSGLISVCCGLGLLWLATKHTLYHSIDHVLTKILTHTPHPQLHHSIFLVVWFMPVNRVLLWLFLT